MANHYNGIVMSTYYKIKYNEQKDMAIPDCKIKITAEVHVPLSTLIRY